MTISPIDLSTNICVCLTVSLLVLVVHNQPLPFVILGADKVISS